MIKIQNLTKSFGNNIVLSDVSFEIGKGEIVGFLGPNGAGKSTTMNILTGYLSFTEGKVEIDGLDMFDFPNEAKKSIGYLPETPPLYPEMTVTEYLNFVRICKAEKLLSSSEKSILEISEAVGFSSISYFNRVFKRVRSSSPGSYRKLKIEN